MNRTRFPKDDHLPDWTRRDNKVTKGDRAEYVTRRFTDGCAKITNVTTAKTAPQLLPGSNLDRDRGVRYRFYANCHR